MPRKKNAVRKDGRLSAQIYLGLIDGKRKYKTLYARTQKELDSKVLETKLRLKKGIDISSERETFKQWADKWLKLKAQEVSAGRLVTYKCCLKKLERLYPLPITKICTSDIQEIILELSQFNGNTQKPSSKKSLIDIKNTASQIMRLAIENRIMDYNPATAVKIPQHQQSNERRALTEEEQSWIINTPHRAQRAAMIMMFSGLRRGELIPLTWNDIDLESGTITVNKSVEFINGIARVKNTAKTVNSIRTVYIPKILIDFLKTQKKDNCILVCPSTTGNMMTSTGWKRMWESYLCDLNMKYGQPEDEVGKQIKSKFAPVSKELNIPKFTAHWLRHTYITMLYFAGVDVLTVKEQAGHADIKTTMDIYTHLDKKYKKKSMDKLNDYLNNKCKSVASQ